MGRLADNRIPPPFVTTPHITGPSAKWVVLVTRSAQGLGRGIALRLARDGSDIALNDVSSGRDQLRAVADSIEKIDRRIFSPGPDVTIDREVKGIFTTRCQGTWWAACPARKEACS